MNRNFTNINNKEILFLQGPMGNYFRKLQLKLSKNNNVFRIGFNKGDEFFSLKYNFYPYRDTPIRWRNFINSFLKKKKIKIIFLFGDCRFYHKIAIQEARKLNVDTYVFEEGYIRPNYITLERNGVNFNSEILNKRSDILNKIKVSNRLLQSEKNFPKNKIFFKMAFQSFLYYLISNLYNSHYPNYCHHREFSVFKEVQFAILNVYRLIKNKILEFNFEQMCKNKYKNKYYFVPLQTYNDFQMKVHSKYNSIEEFIEEVLKSFSEFADTDKYIFFKHHPVDRGRKNYYKTIMIIAKELNIESRVKIFYDVNIPTLLKNAIATLVINSSVGFSSLYHRTPVLCLGKSIYDIEGLTGKNVDLHEFWNSKLKVNYDNYKKFRNFLIEKTQINDNFYA